MTFIDSIFHENKNVQERKLMRLFERYSDRLYSEIKSGELSLQEARKEIIKLKHLANEFFPGRLDTFDLIYRPRFNRLLKECYLR